jgi:hypothetical protein
MHNGSRAFCILMALAATGAEAASTSAATTTSRAPVQPGHYRVEAKLVKVSAASTKEMSNGAVLGYYSEDKVARFIQTPGVSTLSMPSVDAAEATTAHIGLTRDVPLPHAAARETGIKLDIVPQKIGSDFGFQVSIKDVRFQGFQDKTATIPLFHTGRVTTSIPAHAQAPAGYYCVNVPVPAQLTVATYDADGRRSASIADANERELLFVKISRG